MGGNGKAINGDEYVTPKAGTCAGIDGMARALTLPWRPYSFGWS